MEAKEVRRPWQLSDELWEKIAPLIPPGKPHPLGCHNSRVPNRRAMEAILAGDDSWVQIPASRFALPTTFSNISVVSTPVLVL